MGDLVDREVGHGCQRLAAGPTYPGAVSKTGEGHVYDHRTRADFGRQCREDGGRNKGKSLRGGDFGQDGRRNLR